MTKKVLGNDPFASNNTDESASKPAAKPSAKPAAKASKRPTARPSKAPKESTAPRASKRPKKNEPDDDLIIAAVPKVPAEARHLSERSHSEPERVEPQREAPASEASPSTSPSSAPVAHAETTSEIAADTASATSATSVTSAEVIEADEERAAIDEAGAEAAVATDASARDEPSAAPVEQEPEGSIEERIRDLESQLDVLLASVGRDRQRGQQAPTPARTANEEATQNSTTIHVQGADEAAGSTSDAASAEPASESDPADIASSEYYARQWGRVALRDRAEDVDEFGLDREFVHKAQPVVDALYSRWWRVETSGVENVPNAGRVILCANHAGAVPYDGLMLAAALRKEHPAHRTLRWLADDFVFHFPFMGVALNRLGAVRACQENAERLLRSSNVVGVFPEGVKGVSKPFGERYQLQRFGRGGHIKLALRTRTPIVPVAIVGSEETHPMLPTGPIAKLFNMQFLPVTPTFPWLGPLGLIPLPSKWSITFLDPLPVDGYDKDAADDELLVGRLNEKVRAAIQDELARRVRSRQSAWR